jgi:hypothetical protein
MDSQTCRVCGITKPLSGYYIRGNGHPRSLCRQCFNKERGERRHKPWTVAEDDRIRESYPGGGWSACALEGRTRMSVQQRAYKLGVGRETHIGKHKTDNRERFGLPVDTRPDSDKALDYVLRDFRLCEPAQNLTWILKEAA